MLDLVKQTLIGQFDAALSMLNLCLQKCPAEHWDGKVAKYPFWMVAYHTLCFLDLYFESNEKVFQPHAMHPAGWSEYNDEYPSRRFERQELLDYVALCRRRLHGAISSETRESLAGESGFHRLAFTRAELHLYNLRHLQHHVGQLTAFLRRVDETLQDPQAVPWVKTGWR